MRLAVVALSTSTIKEENTLFSVDLVIQLMRITFIVVYRCAFCFFNSLIGLSSAF
jgi:hypothetical protein